MTNTIQTVKNATGIIAKLGAGMLADKCQFAKSIDKEDPNVFGGVNGFMSGDTAYINKPARFIPYTSADVTSNIRDVVEEKTTLTLDNRQVIAVQLTSKEIATDLALKDWTKRVLEPAVSSMAQHIEKSFLQTAVQATYNAVGTAGSTVFDTNTMLSATQKLDEAGCPDFDNRFALLNPAANRSAVTARNGLFQASDEVSKLYKNGAMGIADGMTYLRNNLLPVHTNGNDVVFEVRTTVSTEGQSTLVVEALTTTTGTVKKGTVFTIAGVYQVHPITKQTLSNLQQFTVTADATADGSGYATLSVSPSFYTSASAGLQNIDAFPVDGAAITPVGAASTSYGQSLVFHKSAFRMVSVPLTLPDGTDMADQHTVDGFTFRAARQWNILTDTMVLRLDFLGGIAAVRPSWACRVYS